MLLLRLPDLLSLLQTRMVSHPPSAEQNMNVRAWDLIVCVCFSSVFTTGKGHYKSRILEQEYYFFFAHYGQRKVARLHKHML